MSDTPSLQITLIEESQNSKEVTANDALTALEAALCYLKTVAMADANQTLSDADANGYIVYNCTGALTAQRNLVVPTRNKIYAVVNSTTGGYGVQVKTSAGTGVVVPSAASSFCYSDGTNVIALGSASGASALTLKVDGTDNVVQDTLDLISGTGITVTDNGDGTVTIDSTVMVGDSGSGGTKGAVPAPSAGDAAAGKFLKADGTFAVPAGTGMSNPMTTAGDIIYGGSSGTPTRLAAGSEDSVLSIQSGNPAWRRKGQVDVNTESTTSRTLALTDAGSIIRCTNGSATSITVPPNSSVAFSVGDSISVRQAGAGQVTIVQGSGVTVNVPYGGTLVLAGQGAFVQLYKTATDTWDLVGQVVSA